MLGILPSRSLLVKSQQWKRYNGKNKGKRTTSCIPPENVRQPMVVWRFQGVYKTSFWCLNFYLGTDFAHCSVVKTVDLEQVNASWAYLRPNSKSYLPEHMLTSVPLNF